MSEKKLYECDAQCGMTAIVDGFLERPVGWFQISHTWKHFDVWNFCSYVCMRNAIEVTGPSRLLAVDDGE